MRRTVSRLDRWGVDASIGCTTILWIARAFSWYGMVFRRASTRLRSRSCDRLLYGIYPTEPAPPPVRTGLRSKSAKTCSKRTFHLMSSRPLRTDKIVHSDAELRIQSLTRVSNAGMHKPIVLRNSSVAWILVTVSLALWVTET